VDVVEHAAATAELEALPPQEYEAMQRAIEKLETFGDRLGFPHSSQVKGADRLRELRPRAGRSRMRALYRRVDKQLVIAAIGPEALHDPRGFRRAVHAAEERLASLERNV
jgi:hypothetical protein